MVFRELSRLSPQEWLSLSAPEILLDVVSAAAAPKVILAPLAVSGQAASASSGFDMAAIRPARELPAFTANERSPLARSRSWDAAISAALHVAALAALLTWATPVTETASPEPVTIEIVADTPAPRSASLRWRRRRRPRRSSNRRPSPNPLPLRSRKRPRRRPSSNPLPLRSRNRPRRRPSPNPCSSGRGGAPAAARRRTLSSSGRGSAPAAARRRTLSSSGRGSAPAAARRRTLSSSGRGSAATQAGRRADAAALAPRRVPRRRASRSRCRPRRVLPRREFAKPPPSERPTPPRVAKPTPPEKMSPRISREPPESSRSASRATKLASLPPQAAPAASSAEVAAYQGEVLGRIAAQKRYPEAARERAPQGVAIIRFSIAASGQLAGASLSRSAGDPLLDAEALATVRRASPFPPPPAGAPRNFSVPLSYRVQ